MIDVKCAVVILNPYFLGIQLEGIAGKFQGLRGMFVSSGMINRYVLVLRYPFHNIHHPLTTPSARLMPFEDAAPTQA